MINIEEMVPNSKKRYSFLGSENWELMTGLGVNECRHQ
jgi:hypothetical protein